MWFIMLLAAADIDRHAAEIAQNSRNSLLIQAYGTEAYEAELKQRRLVKRDTGLMFWGILAAIGLFFMNGCTVPPVRPPPQYTVAPDPCAGVPSSPVGLNNPWFACRTRVAQAEERQRMERDNKFLRDQRQAAKDKGICNGYNTGGCLPDDAGPPLLTAEDYYLHADAYDAYNAAHGNTLSYQSLQNRGLLPTHTPLYH